MAEISSLSDGKIPSTVAVAPGVVQREKDINRNAFECSKNSAAVDSVEFSKTSNKDLTPEQRKDVATQFREELKSFVTQKGVFFKTWNWLKNKTGLGTGSAKIEELISRFEKGEVSIEEVKRQLKDFGMNSSAKVQEPEKGQEDSSADDPKVGDPKKAPAQPGSNSDTVKTPVADPKTVPQKELEKKFEPKSMNEVKEYLKKKNYKEKVIIPNEITHFVDEAGKCKGISIKDPFTKRLDITVMKDDGSEVVYTDHDGDGSIDEVNEKKITNPRK